MQLVSENLPLGEDTGTVGPSPQTLIEGGLLLSELLSCARKTDEPVPRNHQTGILKPAGSVSNRHIPFLPLHPDEACSKMNLGLSVFFVLHSPQERGRDAPY